ncbi:hypothetical protein MUA31_09145 [Staphylococcus simulans]|uniref:hypothetical protein n=1 Tax=Staphylococcus simulans TaxID=1286 RepID=UPI0021D2A550|nr:hypothetical protein [Staphylococcus simulans]UXR34545.1 hypothetical protein MUA31_09145 [Staphylococcus simulans]
MTLKEALKYANDQLNTCTGELYVDNMREQHAKLCIKRIVEQLEKGQSLNHKFNDEGIL